MTMIAIEQGQCVRAIDKDDVVYVGYAVVDSNSNDRRLELNLVTGGTFALDKSYWNVLVIDRPKIDHRVSIMTHPNADNPFYDATTVYEDGEVKVGYYDSNDNFLDVTEEFNAWMKTQPTQHTLAVVWEEAPSDER